MSDPRRAMIWKGIFEVILITIGVFLAMEVDQWREHRQRQQQARATLQRFRTEIQTNQAAVQKVQAYHDKVRTLVAAYLDPKTRAAADLHLEGVQPVVFQHTAWDLAIATQSLADIEPDLAYELARVYGLQQMYEGLTTGLTYLRPPSEDLTKFLHSLKIYLDDIVIHEPALAANYQQILPLIERALRH